MKKKINHFLQSLPSHLQRGNKAEKQAQQHLHQQGLITVTKNYRCKAGEIDLLMRDQDVLVFIEVRYRSNPFFGSAAESITAAKIRRIRNTAEHFLLKNKQYSHLYNRFDVIAISGQTSQEKLLWIKDAF